LNAELELDGVDPGLPAEPGNHEEPAAVIDTEAEEGNDDDEVPVHSKTCHRGLVHQPRCYNYNKMGVVFVLDLQA
jgi:hypothetical protein